MTWKPDVCIYHHPCNDGFAAAWVVKQKWPDVEFIGRNYGQTAPEVAGKNVLIVDFSYSASVLERMEAESIILLDHHKSAEKDLEAVPRFDTVADFHDIVPMLEGCASRIMAQFDMGRCGAYLAWDFCFPNSTAPNLIKWVQDRDLWEWQYPETRAVDLYLRSLPYEFEAWDDAMGSFEESLECVLAAGSAIERWLDVQLAALVDGATMVDAFGAPRSDGLRVPAVNAPPVMASDIGHKLLEEYQLAPYAVIYWDSFGGRTYSLRARKGGTDVSEIAKSFGGGGHAAAAGFRVPRI